MPSCSFCWLRCRTRIRSIPPTSTEYVSQLASFSNVEQGMKMNTKLDQLLTVSNLSQASTLVGHTLTSADGTVAGIVESVRVDSSGAHRHFH